MIGAAERTQVTIGAQLGGQGYSEIVFFKDQAALDDFKRNNLEFAANASAVDWFVDFAAGRPAR